MSVCVFRPSWRSNWPNWPRDYCTASFCRAFSINRLRYSGSCAPSVKTCRLPKPARHAHPNRALRIIIARCLYIIFAVEQLRQQRHHAMQAGISNNSNVVTLHLLKCAENKASSYAAGQCWRPNNEPVRIIVLGVILILSKAKLILVPSSSLQYSRAFALAFFAITLLHFGCQIGPFDRRIR